MKAKKLDKKFDSGEDVLDHFDLTKGRRVNQTKEIKTNEDYQAALDHLEHLMTIAEDREGEPLLDEINIVADAIEQYEINIPSVKRYLKETDKLTEEELLKGLTPETAHAAELAELSSKEYELEDLLKGCSLEKMKLDKEDKEWLNEQIDRCLEDNPDLPRDFIKEALNSRKEVEQGKTEEYKFDYHEDKDNEE